MLIKVVRKVSIDEARQRVSHFERKYGGNLEDIQVPAVAGGTDRELLEDSVEWSRMVHALRAYGEGEDFDYALEETVELGRSEVSKLTPRRLELLDQLSRLRASSINDLARKAGRNVKNVYGDLKALEALGFVGLVRRGRRIVPELLVHEITLLLG